MTGSTPQKSSVKKATIEKHKHINTLCSKSIFHLKILTAQRLDVARSIFLEQQFQRIDIVKLHPRHASNEAVLHRFVFANVHVLDVVELCIRRVLDVEMVLLWLVVIDLLSIIIVFKTSQHIFVSLCNVFTFNTTVDPEFFRENRTSWY